MKHLEDQLHKSINQFLYFRFNNKFGDKSFYTYMPFGEKRNAVTGALLKFKGTKKGVPDFMLLVRKNEMTQIIWVECKCGKNKQSIEQIDFENKTKEQVNEGYFIVYSLDEFIEIFNHL